MLLSNNAVHSALFLIVTMGCVAFLVQLLNAPFLAMIQVTVYTGAIMVLFLFVIMLLGFESLQQAEVSDAPKFRWYMPLAIGLPIALLLIVGIVLGQVNLDLRADTTPQPQVRVLNAAPDAGTLTVSANDTQIAANVAFRDSSAYFSLPAGNYTIKLQPAQGNPVTTTVSLEQGTQQTVVAYGIAGTMSAAVVPDNNTTMTEDRSARVTVVDGYNTLQGVELVDLGTSLNLTNAPSLAGTLHPGVASSPLTVPEGTVNWAFVDAANPADVLLRLDNYTISRDTSSVIVLAEQHITDGSANGKVLGVAATVTNDTDPAYGGPQAIGLQLFTNYMLVFQLLAVLLLAAMVGAIVLTHREARAGRRVGGRRRVSRPLVNVIAAQVGHEVTEPGEGVPELQEPVGK
ncbi:MAG TPA: NADH-quinone oxidoreductase subunit J [Phototrophicaceae bacterium]|nr:NADH-quinone oxidoreductase subunit J [Phototrophicaceae bacterium]